MDVFALGITPKTPKLRTGQTQAWKSFVYVRNPITWIDLVLPTTPKVPFLETQREREWLCLTEKRYAAKYLNNFVKFNFLPQNKNDSCYFKIKSFRNCIILVSTYKLQLLHVCRTTCIHTYIHTYITVNSTSSGFDGNFYPLFWGFMDKRFVN